MMRDRIKMFLLFLHCFVLWGCGGSGELPPKNLEQPLQSIHDRYVISFQGRYLDPQYTHSREPSTTEIRYLNSYQNAHSIIVGTAFSYLSPEEQQAERKAAIARAPGGNIALTVRRAQTFNLAWFSVVIKDLKGREIYRKDLEPDRIKPLYNQQTGLWLNTQNNDVPVLLPVPFCVEVEDRAFHATYKYKVDKGS